MAVAPISITEALRLSTFRANVFFIIVFPKMVIVRIFISLPTEANGEMLPVNGGRGKPRAIRGCRSLTAGISQKGKKKGAENSTLQTLFYDRKTGQNIITTGDAHFMQQVFVV
ncbi:hypothetical protein AAIA72_08580 [Hahella sp. SMD15-11]|uniref:Uncharacterized protein n=1 Tax=Thermohahella caldifontis TaxID=3142973 RepID=A0AB39V0W2_9GAMM